jgi:hypothetical protein
MFDFIRALRRVSQGEAMNYTKLMAAFFVAVFTITLMPATAWAVSPYDACVGKCKGYAADDQPACLSDCAGKSKVDSGSGTSGGTKTGGGEVRKTWTGGGKVECDSALGFVLTEDKKGCECKSGHQFWRDPKNTDSKYEGQCVECPADKQVNPTGKCEKPSCNDVCANDTKDKLDKVKTELGKVKTAVEKNRPDNSDVVRGLHSNWWLLLAIVIELFFILVALALFLPSWFKGRGDQKVSLGYQRKGLEMQGGAIQSAAEFRQQAEADLQRQLGAAKDEAQRQALKAKTAAEELERARQRQPQAAPPAMPPQGPPPGYGAPPQQGYTDPGKPPSSAPPPPRRQSPATRLGGSPIPGMPTGMAGGGRTNLGVGPGDDPEATLEYPATRHNQQPASDPEAAVATWLRPQLPKA